MFVRPDRPMQPSSRGIVRECFRTWETSRLHCSTSCARHRQAYIGEALARREYVGWLASPAADPEMVVAGAGAQLRRAFPHMLKLPDGPVVAQGRHAIVLNVFTEPEWRHQGLAELLMRQVITWAREEQLDRLVLHASPQARALYERLGFQGTNEMRFQGLLRGLIEEPCHSTAR